MPLNHVTLLYRGVLASCNYACNYCPFARHVTDNSNHLTDQQQLTRFVDWLGTETTRTYSVFFTPQGEALIHSWYQNAVARLACMDHLAKVAIQTNLSCRLDWLASCPPHRIGLWCSYHPSQVSHSAFLQQCRVLDRLGISYSVGVVGLYEHLPEIEKLRHALRRDVYLWVNAFKHSADYYDSSTIQRIERVDPLFRLNLENHACHGRQCHCGTTVFSISGDGSVRRCHFVDDVFGNLFNDAGALLAHSDGCPQDACRCHIGYVHLHHLRLGEVFTQGILERAPSYPFRFMEMPA